MVRAVEGGERVDEKLEEKEEQAGSLITTQADYLKAVSPRNSRGNLMLPGNHSPQQLLILLN